jgi:hypothetical protein
MKRAILVALGTGAIISSAAALSVGTAAIPRNPISAHNELDQSRIRMAARDAQREQIEARYRAARAQCDALGGRKLDNCLINAHAVRGRALLDTHTPYTMD